MVQRLNWSLKEIDETDCQSIFDFIFRLSHRQENGGRRKAYCDEVEFL